VSPGPLATFLLLASASVATAEPCDFFEIPARDGGHEMQVFSDPRTPWRVTVDLPTATVEVAGPGRCKTALEDISSVYMGPGGRIVFRTAQVASEQLFTIDAATCRDVGAPVDVDTANAAAFRKVLRARHICPR
jgi:hypothetical protein